MNQLRGRCRCRALVLITHDSSLLKALIFASSPSKAESAAIETRFREEELAPTHESPLDAALDLLKAWGFGAFDIVGEYHADEQSSVGNLSCSLLALDCAKPVPPTATETIAEMLNGTAVANARRDQRVTRLVEKFRRSATEAAHPADYLLRLALEVVRGDSAALYTAEDFALVKELQLGTDVALPPTVPLVSEEDASQAALDASAAIAQAHAKLSTIISPSPEMSLALPLQPYRLAAIPVTRTATASLPQAASRVLVVTKPVGSEFSLYQLTLLRNVSLRLALLLGISSLETSVEVLGRVAARLTVRPLLASLSPAEDRLAAAKGIPWDHYVATEALTMLANELMRTTSSSSVTLRALMRAQYEGRMELILRRFIATPPKRLHDSRRDLPLGTYGALPHPWQRSVNAYVAATGSMCYLRDRTKDPRAQGYPDLHRPEDIAERATNQGSELCVPIWADGFLVGTMNLESPTKDAYGLELPTVLAFAAVAGLALTAARQSISRFVAELVSRLRIGPHEAAKIDRALAALRQIVPATARAHLDAIRTNALRALDQTDDDQPSGAETVSGRELLEGVIVQQGFRGASLALTQDFRVPARDAGRLTAALREVMENADTHKSKHAAGPTIRTASYRVAGGNYVTIAVTSVPKIQPGALVEMKAFRAPIRSSDSPYPRLGCYSAGQLMMMLGGAAFLTRRPDDHVETFLIVPPSGTHNGGADIG